MYNFLHARINGIHLIISSDLETIITLVGTGYVGEIVSWFGVLLQTPLDTPFFVVDVVFKLEICGQTWWFVRLPSAFIDHHETSLNSAISIRLIQPSHLYVLRPVCTSRAVRHLHTVLGKGHSLWPGGC